MNDKVVPSYYSIMQLCERWDFDLRQMHDAISKYNSPLHACITGKNGGAFNQPVKVRETAINTGTGNDLEKFGSLTNDELEKQGFIITTVEPKLYLARKESMSFYIDYSNEIKTVKLTDLNDFAYDVPHNNFVELCDESSIDPQKCLANLFEKEELFILLVKCKKAGYLRFLEPACFIKLEDIYIHHEDVHRIEQQTTTIQPQNTKDIDTIINTTLKSDLNLLLRKTFPEYSGQIAKKTSAPHGLIIKVIVMMRQLQQQDITWTTVREFIEEHLYGNHDRTILAKLDSIDDNAIIVNGLELINSNASRRVSEYKNKFGINR